MEFDKAVGDLFRVEMPPAELAYPRRVNHIAAVREVVQARGRSGVLPQSGDIRNVIGKDLVILQSQQRVQQAGFAKILIRSVSASSSGFRPSCVRLETISTR